MRLKDLEGVIAAGLHSFLAVGNALREVQEGKLYRAVDTTFEGYCRKRWDMSRPRAYQFMEAASIVEVLSTKVDIDPPSHERHVRELKQLDTPQQQADAWERAVETAPKDSDGNPKVTAAHVKQVVVAIRAESRGDGDDFDSSEDVDAVGAAVPDGGTFQVMLAKVCKLVMDFASYNPNPTARKNVASQLRQLAGEVEGLDHPKNEQPAAVLSTDGNPTQIADPPRKRRPEPISAADVEYPAGMDTPEVRTALDEWLQYKRGNGQTYKDGKSVDKLLRKHAREHGSRAAEKFPLGVENSIGNRYAGLIVPRDPKPKSLLFQADRPGMHYDPDAKGFHQ